jgi:hypothetical protein
LLRHPPFPPFEGGQGDVKLPGNYG